MPEMTVRPEKEVIGGQAVIEGVMMRSKNYMAVAVRRPDKSIAIETKRLDSLTNRFPILRKPFVRGVYTMFDSLIIGLKALTYSANESAEDEDEQLSDREIAFTLVFAMALSIGIFVVLPFVISKMFTENNFLFNVIDGILRMAFFFLYILLISRMEDIQRVFMYHGAEHKTVNTYEAGEKLTVKNAKKHTTLHPRCGTTFLLFVVIISILVFSLIIHDSWWVKFGARIVLLPVIAGISYEVLRFSASYYRNSICRWFIKPGLLLQKMTTNEPTDDQLEIAITSLKKVLALEKKHSV